MNCRENNRRDRRAGLVVYGILLTAMKLRQETRLDYLNKPPSLQMRPLIN